MKYSLEADAIGLPLGAPLAVEVGLDYVRHLGACNLLHALPVQHLEEARVCVHVRPYGEKNAVVFSRGVGTRCKQRLFNMINGARAILVGER